MNTTHLSWIACALASAMLATACATKPPGSLNIENVQTLSATVESVDPERRLIALRAQDGRLATLAVGPDVRNLSQVKPGSSVLVRYYQSLEAQLKKKRKTPALNKVRVADATGRDNPGSGGSTLTTTVLVESVDRSLDTVTFKEPSGRSRTVAVRTPGGKEFIERLRKGDEVEVTFTEAFAFGVMPAN